MWVTEGPFRLLINLISQGGLIVFFALVLFRLRFFRGILSRSKITIKDKIFLIIFFSTMGIIGTYTGIPIQGALANSRVVGVFVGGLIGGPVVGITTGIIAGMHRWAIDIGGFTSVACMVSTIVEGLLSAFLSRKFRESENKWVFAFLAGIVAETIQMIIILIIARPFQGAIDLVTIIGIPMILGNAIGISMFVAISESFFNEEERIIAKQSQKILKIVEKTLPIFRKGFTEDSAGKTAKIILRELDVSAVAFTNTEKVLAHSGIGHNHYTSGMSIQTELTHKAITLGTIQIAQLNKDIGYKTLRYSLQSAVIAPLMKGDKVIGTLKLYRDKPYSISQSDVEIAKGLASLLSLQVELSAVDKNDRLLVKAELRALQSQIQPHFLFNAINTISSMISDDSTRAKALLLDLSDYYRNRLYLVKDMIPLKAELDNIKTYVSIEKARFGDKISVIIEPLCDQFHCMVPPLILQPIVENAVKHGVQKNLMKSVVNIGAQRNDTDLIVTISDNGSGIQHEKIDEILNKEQQIHGLSNVNQRLINLYGEDYALRIASEEGKGTTIWIRIPLNYESLEHTTAESS